MISESLANIRLDLAASVTCTYDTKFSVARSQHFTREDKIGVNFLVDNHIKLLLDSWAEGTTPLPIYFSTLFVKWIIVITALSIGQWANVLKAVKTFFFI